MEDQVIFVDCGSYMTKGAILNPNHPQLAFEVTEMKTTMALTEVFDQELEETKVQKTKDMMGSTFNIFDARKEDLMIENNLSLDKAVPFWRDLIRKLRHLDSLDSLSHGEATDRRLMLAINQRLSRQKAKLITERAFQTLNCKQFYIANPAVLTLYSELQTTGVVVDMGHGHTQIVPVVNGFRQSGALAEYQFCGHQINQFIGEQMVLDNVSASQNFSLNLEIIEKLKHSKDSESIVEEQILPDNTEINLHPHWKRQLCQHFTQPLLVRRFYNPTQQSRIHKNSVIRVLMNCVENYLRSEKEQHNIFDTVVFAGGQVQMDGLVQHLRESIFKEFSDRYSLMEPIFVEQDPSRAVLRGGALLAGLGNQALNQMMISDSEYVEHGPSIVNRKCF